MPLFINTLQVFWDPLVCAGQPMWQPRAAYGCGALEMELVLSEELNLNLATHG